MTSNNQVSPVIRISRGERDASARATHLKAASKKYLETTIERKQMSTTTNFKRIALVAVAALGLGVLSSVPSQAVTNADSLTLSATSAAQTTAETATATSATATISTLIGDSSGDSVTLVASLVSAPAGATALPYLQLKETTTSVVDTDLVSGSRITLADAGNVVNPNQRAIITNSTTGVTSATFRVYLSSTDANTGPNKAGTYVVRLTPAIGGGGGTLNATAQTLTITVTTAASADTNVSAAFSKVVLQAHGATADAAPVVDSVVSGSNVAGTKIGFVYVAQRNAANTTGASESITAVITGAGTLGTSTAGASVGRSISVKKDDTITVWSDGTSGTGTITVSGSTSGTVLGSKTVTFYGAMANLAGTVNTAILAVGTNNGAVSVGATDAAKAKVTTLNAATLEAIYAFSSDTTIATVPATAVSYSVDSAVVTVTGVKAGSATITFGNATTLAASTIKSAPISVRVGSTAVAAVTVAFDKATYAPGEKATITLSLRDASGLLVVPGTYELWASTYGLTSAKNFSQGTGPASTETSVATAALTGLKTYTVYMPVTAGVVTLTGTLAKTLDDTYAPIGTLKTAAAIQGTTVTASATVTDSGSAALAAVTALATTVASLRTLIVTLTNLVLKIQKKVRA
jgi:trimeric autotransporter adhesin